ncbi:MAG: alpha/beta fold hydrolase [Proteobacteria bacterium]|nr:alpha/beta fold hydrolase [Pseudomonadota bacterium]
MTAGYETILSARTDAPWLVMVHGMSQDRRVFSAQTEAFRDRFKILLIDLPGHGLSGESAGPFGHHEFTEAVADAITDAGVQRCHYWGTHTGATVGLLLATRAPALFASLILEGPVMPGETPQSVAAAIGGARRVAAKEGIAAARDWWFTSSPWFQVMRASPVDCRALEHRGIIDDFTGTPWLSSETPATVAFKDEALKTLTIAALVYNGEHDHADFLATSKRVAALIPNCKRQIIPGGGAFAAWEFPEQVNKLVADFLD